MDAFFDKVEISGVSAALGGLHQNDTTKPKQSLIETDLDTIKEEAGNQEKSQQISRLRLKRKGTPALDLYTSL